MGVSSTRSQCTVARGRSHEQGAKDYAAGGSCTIIADAAADGAVALRSLSQRVATTFKTGTDASNSSAFDAAATLVTVPRMLRGDFADRAAADRRVRRQRPFTGSNETRPRVTGRASRAETLLSCPRLLNRPTFDGQSPWAITISPCTSVSSLCELGKRVAEAPHGAARIQSIGSICQAGPEPGRSCAWEVHEEEFSFSADPRHVRLARTE